MAPEQAIQWVTEVMGHGSRVVSAQPLGLGRWHVNHAVDVVDAHGHTHRVVLRRWGHPDWEADDPDYTVEREVRVLGLLEGTPIPVPAVVAADPTGERCDVPAMLLTRLPGHPPAAHDGDVDGFCRQLAETLAAIHDIDGDVRARLDPYRLYFQPADARPATWMPATTTWRRATDAVREPPPASRMTMIHRDYHPENTLWSRGRLTGVVDWTQASWGPPAFDLGHMRWNLLLDRGPAVADRFLAAYRATTGTALADQPYWDLVAVFDLLLADDDPGDIDPDDVRRLERYAADVLRRWR